VPGLPHWVMQDEDIINAYIGVSYRFTDYLTATASYNFTDSSSDFDGSRL
jgi:long-subunit fatty acid transport protein